MRCRLGKRQCQRCLPDFFNESLGSLVDPIIGMEKTGGRAYRGESYGLCFYDLGQVIVYVLQVFIWK